MSSFWRYRIRFSKRGTIRFISHRDLMGVFARAFRRARLPLRMSEGFNPRPRFSLPAPLAVGIEGLAEVLELDLCEELAPDALTAQFRAELPGGLELVRTDKLVPPKKAQVRSHTYEATGPAPPAGAADRLMAAAEVWAVRRDGKRINIRPYIRQVRVQDDVQDGAVRFEVAVTPEATPRPAEVIEALYGTADALKHLALVRTAVEIDTSDPPNPSNPSDR